MASQKKLGLDQHRAYQIDKDQLHALKGGNDSSAEQDKVESIITDDIIDP